jgi:hypothetical protein
MACRFDLPDVEKCLAEPSVSSTKPNPFLGIEPLHPRLGLTAADAR